MIVIINSIIINQNGNKIAGNNCHPDAPTTMITFKQNISGKPEDISCLKQLIHIKFTLNIVFSTPRQGFIVSASTGFCGWMDGWMKRWMNGQSYGWMNGLMDV